MGAAPSEQHPVEWSAGVSGRTAKDSNAGKVSYSHMDYRYYHSDGVRRVQPVDVDVPASAVPPAVVFSQHATARHMSPDRSRVEPSVRHRGGMVGEDKLGTGPSAEASRVTIVHHGV